MREFANAASARGMTFGSLAQALNAAGGNLTAANVSKHFESAICREATIEAYARVLAFEPAHVRLARGEHLTSRQLAAYEERALRDIALKFAATAEAVVRDVMLEDPELRVRSIEAYALAMLRADKAMPQPSIRESPIGDMGVWYIDPYGAMQAPLLVFVRMLTPRVDFTRHLKSRAREASVLASIDAALRYLPLDIVERDAVLAMIRLLAAKCGLDPLPLDEALAASRQFAARAPISNRSDHED